MGVEYDWNNVLRWDLQSKDADKLARKLGLSVRVGRFHLKNTENDHPQELHGMKGAVGDRVRALGLDGAGQAYVLRKIEHSFGNQAKIDKFLAQVEKSQGIMQGDEWPEGRREQYHPDGKPIPGTDEWREAHGISEAVYASRPYHRFEGGQDFSDLPPEVQAMYEDGTEQMAGAKRQLQKIMAQDGGIIMERSPAEGLETSDKPIPPQVRPDQAVINDNRDLKRRLNGRKRAEDELAEAEAHTKTSVVEKQQSRVDAAEKRIEDAKTMTKEKYVEDANNRLSEAEETHASLKKARAQARKDKVEGWREDPEFGDDAFENSQKELNSSKRNAKKVNGKADFEFKDGEEAYRERATKSAEKQKEYAEGKLERYKADPDAAITQEVDNATKRLADAQSQLEKVPAKYLFPPVPASMEKAVERGDEPSSSARLEVHGAENMARLEQGKGRVYLAMEGNLKSDAVQSAIEREGDPEAAVISVPSVTLWRHSEMLEVAGKQLKGREVVLIPDADGETNANVRNEARALQAMLVNAGASDVKVAAPPMDPELTRTGKQKVQDGVDVRKPKAFDLPSGAPEKAKGVDDWLATNSGLDGTLGGMDVLGREVPVVRSVDSLTRSQQSAHFRGEQIAGIDVVTPTAINPTQSKNMENTMRALHYMMADRNGAATDQAVVSVTRLGAAIGTTTNNLYDNGRQAGRSLDYLEKAGLIRREYVYDADEWSRGTRAMHPKMTPSRVNELVSARVIDEPDFGRPVDDPGRNESPIISVLGPQRSRDLPRQSLSSIGRSVSSPEGAAYYGVPEGTPLTPEIISKAAEKIR